MKKKKPPEVVDLQVGKLIRAQRLAVGMSQTALGEKLGVTFQQVQKYENGANRIGSSRLVRIAQAIGVEPSFFFSSHKTTSEEPEILGLVRNIGAAKLLRAFAAIKDAKLRKSIVALTVSLRDL
jgi:transcriptional regulator with XRE-family HTH domain